MADCDESALRCNADPLVRDARRFVVALGPEIADRFDLDRIFERMWAAQSTRDFTALHDHTMAFARRVEGLPSGYYALGASFFIDPRKRNVHPVGTGGSERSVRNGIGSEQRIARILHNNLCASADRVLMDSLCRNLRISDPLTNLAAIQEKAGTIWRSWNGGDQKKWGDPERIQALYLWFFALQSRLKDHPEILEGAEPQARALLGVVGHGNKTTGPFRQAALKVLASLLYIPNNWWALDFLVSLSGAIQSIYKPQAVQNGLQKEDRASLVDMTAGILARHGHRLQGEPHAAVTDGALLFLDVARESGQASKVAQRVFLHGFWAVEKFVPRGAEIIYHWVTREVERSQNPDWVAFLALAYAAPFEKEREKPVWDRQRRRVLWRAVRRGILSNFQRQSLLAKLGGQTRFARGWNGLVHALS